MKANIILFLFVFSAFVSCSNKRPAEYYHTKGRIFHTDANFKYKHSQVLDDEIFALLDSFDLSLNPFNKQSIIYKVNNNIPVEVDDWFITVFNQAKTVSELSGGLYDITAAPLINLWGFGFENMGEPSREMIDSIGQFVGFDKIRLEGRSVVKDDPRVQLNASSIAKGYAVDVVADFFEKQGIDNYMVEIGGEVRTKGLNPKGNVWRIEIVKPIDDNTGKISERFTVVDLKDKSLATSGNSRNYYIKENKKYAHTINPLTGYPSESNMLSASVIHPQCLMADAFATTFMVMGLEKAMELATTIPDMQCLFIYSGENGEVLSVSNIKD